MSTYDNDLIISKTLWNILHIFFYDCKKSLKIPKRVIRIRKSKKDRQNNGKKKKRTKGQTTIGKTLHIKTKDRVTRTPLKPEVNSGVPEGWAVHVPLVAPITTFVPYKLHNYLYVYVTTLTKLLDWLRHISHFLVN